MGSAVSSHPSNTRIFTIVLPCPLYAHLEECLLAEPLRQLLLAQPGLSLQLEDRGLGPSFFAVQLETIGMENDRLALVQLAAASVGTGTSWSRGSTSSRLSPLPLPDGTISSPSGLTRISSTPV
jgi:hypothetical protein